MLDSILDKFNSKQMNVKRIFFDAISKFLQKNDKELCDLFIQKGTCMDKIQNLDISSKNLVTIYSNIQSLITDLFEIEKQIQNRISEINASIYGYEEYDNFCKTFLNEDIVEAFKKLTS